MNSLCTPFLSRAVADFPTRATAWCCLATARQDAGQLDAALEAAEKAVALSPDTPEPVYNRGRAHHALKHWAEAKADFQKVLAMGPMPGTAEALQANIQAIDKYLEGQARAAERAAAAAAAPKKKGGRR